MGWSRVRNSTKEQLIPKRKIYEKLNLSTVQVRVNCESAIVMGRGVE